MCALTRRCYHTNPNRRALKTSVDSCMEIKSASSVVQPIMAEFGGRCWRAIHKCDTELLLIYKKHERQTTILMQSSLIWHILQCTIFPQQPQKKGKETSTVLKLYSGNLIVHKALEFDSFSFKILSPPLFLHPHFNILSPSPLFLHTHTITCTYHSVQQTA